MQGTIRVHLFEHKVGVRIEQLLNAFYARMIPMKLPAIRSAAVRHNNDYGWCCGMKRPQKRKQLCIKVGASSDIGGLKW